MFDEEECEQLMEEYEMLRRRLESTEFAEIEEAWEEEEDVADLLSNSDLDIDPDDIRRLDEIEHRITVECGEDLPTGEDEVDIPDYIRDEFTS